MANMFDENGNYNKTEWKPGDRITAGKLNKIEESLEAINNNDIERHKEADERLDALEEQKEAVEERFDELEDLVADNKTEVDTAIYEVHSKMDRLEQEMNDGIDTVEAIAHTVDDKIADADASMKAQVAEVEGDLEGLHAKDEELSSQLADNAIKLNELWADVKNFGAVCDGITDDTEAIKSVIEQGYKNIKIDNCLIQANIAVPEGVNLLISNLVYKGVTTTNKSGCMFFKGNNVINGLNKINEGIVLIADGSNILFENIIINNSQRSSFNITTRSETTYQNITFRNCISKMSIAHGFGIEKYYSGVSDNSSVSSVIYDNCEAYTSGANLTGWSAGFLIADVTNASNITYKNCIAEDSVESGFHIEENVGKTNIIYDNCISMNNGQRKEGSVYGSGFFVYENTYFNNCYTYNNANSPYYHSYSHKEVSDSINKYHFLSKDIDIYENGVKYEYKIINGENGFALNEVFNKSNCFFPFFNYNLYAQAVGDNLILNDKFKLSNGCIKISLKNSNISIESPDSFVGLINNNYSLSFPPIKIDASKKYKIRFKASTSDISKNNRIRVGTSIFNGEYKCIQRMHFNKIITLEEKEKYYEYDIVSGSNLINADGVYMALTLVLGYDDTESTYSKKIISDISILPIEYETRSGIPTTGTYKVGDIVKNANPQELGEEGSKYIIEKWVCVTAGSWSPCKILTGN